MKKIIAFPHPPGIGGPGSFQTRFENSLKQAGWTIVYAGTDAKVDVVLVVGGTRRIAWLWKLKKAGVPVVYRLDGINWLHKVTSVPVRTFLAASIRNYMNQVVRRYFADKIIYQSKFVESWWNRQGWKIDTPTRQIYNGVDLEQFFPLSKKPKTTPVLLCLEGTIDYSPYSIKLLNELSLALRDQISVVVYGGFQQAENRHRLNKEIAYHGKLTMEQLPEAYRNSIYLSLDVNAACPNTVVEALASGAPVVGYDTGALKEMVPMQAGTIVPFGSDPWELGFPDVDALVVAILKVKANWPSYSAGARAVAVERYDVNKITDKYITVIEETIASKHENR